MPLIEFTIDELNAIAAKARRIKDVQGRSLGTMGDANIIRVCDRMGDHAAHLAILLAERARMPEEPQFERRLEHDSEALHQLVARAERSIEGGNVSPYQLSDCTEIRDAAQNLLDLMEPPASADPDPSPPQPAT